MGLGKTDGLIDIIDRNDAAVRAASVSGAPAAADPTALPVFTYDQIADYLREGYWEPRAFNVRSSGAESTARVINYNIDKLNADGRFLAEEALAIYGEELNLKFVRTHATDRGNVEIFFDDSWEGAYTEVQTRGATISYSKVNIGLDWLTQYGTGYDTYSFQTYIHEIGHALGLGHAGEYNETGHYVTNESSFYYGDNSNFYLNDSWQASIMSYFDQDQNTSVDASFAFVMSPMIADLVALGEMYGLRDAFAGDTVWGFNTTITSTVFAHLTEMDEPISFTISDGSGNDTIDLSGYGMRQVIRLGQETASNIGGLVGNVLIARGTVIENVIGGTGAELIVGNEVANLLRGGAGTDEIYGGGAADRLEGGNGTDQLFGGEGNDRLFGGDASDRLYGNSGVDRLYGDAGADRLDGGGGADVLTGGAGRDLLIGGGGTDTFVFRTVADSPAGASCDLLQAGSGGAAFDGAGNAVGDRFDLTGLGDVTWHGAGAGSLSMRNVGNVTHCVVDLDGDGVMDFEAAIADGAVRAAAYSAADFLLA